MLCERGIRTFENYTRNTLDISAIPVVKKLSHLPIVVDPSHGTGRRDKVAPMARAAVAAGADGLIIEVHCDPDNALSDGAQSMFPAQFDRLMAELRIIAPGHRPHHLPRTGDASGMWSKRLPIDCRLTMDEWRLPTAIFGRIGIVGVGLIGGSLAFAVRRVVSRRGGDRIDRDDVTLVARQLGAPITVGSSDLAALAEADLIVLAAPITQNIAVLARLGESCAARRW